MTNHNRFEATAEKAKVASKKAAPLPTFKIPPELVEAGINFLVKDLYPTISAKLAQAREHIPVEEAEQKAELERSKLKVEEARAEVDKAKAEAEIERVRADLEAQSAEYKLKALKDEVEAKSKVFAEIADAIVDMTHRDGEDWSSDRFTALTRALQGRGY